MKYYVYISDAKVDMLAAQIPKRLRDRIAAEMRLDLKVISLSIKSDPSDATRYGRTMLVSEYIRRGESLGTVDEPGPYFGGRLELSWAGIRSHDDEGPSLAYFSGATEKTALGLTGSLHHVIGQAPVAERELGPGPSFLTAGTLQVVARYLTEDDSDDLDGWGPSPQRPLEIVKWYSHRRDNSAYKDIWEPRFSRLGECDFLARRLAHELSADGGVLLGSPIFVSFVD